MTLLLNYAPPKAKRRWPRWIGFALILLAALGAAVRWGPGAWDAASIAYAAHQCRQYVGDPEQVVLESDPKLVPAILSAHATDSQWAVGYYGFQLVNQVALFTPDCWPKLTHFSGRDYPDSHTATLFLHELRITNGERVLVHVAMYSSLVEGGMKDETLSHATEILRDSDIARSGQFIFPESYPFTLLPIHFPNLRVYAGQIDPSDPSHFTIRYRQWDQEDVVDGYLVEPTPGSYRVRYTFRNPPKDPWAVSPEPK